MKEILNGFIDLHLHAGPSAAAREVDAGDMALEDAREYGYRAFVVKDHLFPTMMSAKLTQKHLATGDLEVFGGIVLNNSVGLLNLKALDTAYEMGAKFVTLPTIASANHIEKHKTMGHFPGAGKAAVPERSHTYVDASGRLLPEAEAIVDYCATHPDLILSTGHGSLAEVDAIVRRAADRGVKRLLINHPYYLVDAPYEKMEEWTKLGGYIELNATLIVPESTIFATPFSVVTAILERIPVDKLLLVSDLGQKGNIRPGKGMLRLVEMLMHDAGATEEQINVMGKKNPAHLLGLD